jgi:hypothetical protein
MTITTHAQLQDHSPNRSGPAISNPALDSRPPLRRTTTRAMIASMGIQLVAIQGRTSPIKDLAVDARLT